MTNPYYKLDVGAHLFLPSRTNEIGEHLSNATDSRSSVAVGGYEWITLDCHNSGALRDGGSAFGIWAIRAFTASMKPMSSIRSA